MNARTGLLCLIVATSSLLASYKEVTAQTGPIGSVVPPASQLGPGWQRVTELIAEDLANPPAVSANMQSQQGALKTLSLAIPHFRAANMIGAGIFSYYIQTPNGANGLDTYVTRFKTEADALSFWSTMIPTGGTPYPVGDQGTLLTDASGKILYFRVANHVAKIVVIGNETKLGLLARVLAQNIRTSGG